MAHWGLTENEIENSLSHLPKFGIGLCESSTSGLVDDWRDEC